MSDRNPQISQMSDVSMVENLALQALAIWPQERPLLGRYGLSGAIRASSSIPTLATVDDT